MMSGYHKLKTACCVAVLTLGLAACGGGNQGDNQTAAPDPTPPPTAAEQLMMAESAVAAAQAAVAAAMTPAEISAAYGQLASAQMLLSTAQSIPANQIAILTAQLEQLRMDLQDTEMLAEQRGTVGAALITAQNAVNGLSASSSDADAMAAAALVAAADAALAGASALPEDDSLHGSVAAVVAQLAGVEMSRTVYSQRGMVDAALAAAGELVGGLTNTSTDDEVAAAYAAVMAVQTALAEATALPADDPRHALVMGVEEDLGDARTMRTAHMDTQTINGLISEAQTAVGGLDRVTSSGMAVTEARAAVAAVMAEIAASTALTQAQKDALSGMVSMANTDLTAIEKFRSTADGQLQVANSAIERARALVAGLSSTSTPEEAAAAYGALAEASLALHTATNLPDNVIAKLQDDLKSVQDTLSDAQTATAAVVAATTAVAGVNDDSDEADVDAARTALNNAKTALANAQNLGDSDRTNLQSAIDSLETSLSSIETVVAARPDPMVVAADTAAAKTKTTAIKAEADQEQEDDQGLGGDDVNTIAMTIERPRSGTEIKIADSGLAGEDDPKFAEAMDLGVSDGVATTMHLREMEADDDDGTVKDEVVVVSTDIQAPKAVAFAKFKNDIEGTLTQVLGVRNDDETVDEDNPANSLAVDETSDAVRGLVMSASFTAGTAAVLSFDYAQDDGDRDTPGNQPVAAFEGDGTYNGADGTYKCAAASNDCTVTLDAKGMITAMTAGWIFTPDTGATSDQPDYDHLSYGFWLARTKNADGTVKSYDEVETFTGSSVAMSGTVADVTGKAKYTGGSTGVYVKNVYTSEGEIESATSGLFTADAELKATFGQVLDDEEVGTIAPNLLNSISGTVSDLRNDVDEVIDGSWTVDLMKGPIDSTNGTFGGKTTGNGNYNGAFHGSTTDDDDGSTAQPSSLVGEFDAVFTNGTVTGAFGARK